ncbi:MAG: TIGR04283 family arsenosugar biosynthesis glycosyltransferase [Fuerstiella sp.]
MKISVVIPTYNEQASINAAIQSALDAGADQIVVVDGGSTDNTLQTASTLGATVLKSKPGRAIQQNVGAAACAADVLLFLHADCQLHPDSIQQIRTALQQNQHCVGGCFQQAIADPRFRYRIMERGNQLRVKILKWIYGDQGLFVRQSVFEKLEGFPELNFLEDLYFTKSLSREGRLAVLQAPLIVSARRWQKTGMLLQTFRNWTIIAAAHLGVSPSRLAKFYPSAR